MKLAAQHHWCLTGTPISNKVEDLGALVAFCRVPQLEDRRCFHAHVTKTATKSFKKGCRLLKEVLSPICLRRTKAILAIPQTRQEARVVHFTLDERQMYDGLLRRIRRSLDESVSGKAANKALMLRAILRLREFCDQGTFTSTPDAATDRHFDPDEALALLQQADEARCASCHSEVEILAQMEVSSSAVLGTCSHLICASCHDDGPALEADQRSTFFCPICHAQVPQQTFGSTGRPSCEANLKAHSSKLTAVVADLIETRHCEKRYVGPDSQVTITFSTPLRSLIEKRSLRIFR
jgi:SWI/SNF-related matrix-associated actin-dependent regulator of chromatin subfamily A3